MNNLKDYLNIKYILFISLFLIFTSFHQQIINIAYIFLCILALIRPTLSIKALSLNILVLILSSGIYHYPPGIGIFRWLVIFVAALRVLPFCSLNAWKHLLAILIFFITSLILSLIESPFFLVSSMKLTIFSLYAATVLAAFSSLNTEELDDIKTWVFSLTTVVIIFSLPTLAVPSIGFMRNGSGFQGILSHPQTFALFLAPSAAYLGAEMVMSNNKKCFWALPLGVTIFALLFMARARTAMVAVFLGIFGAAIPPGFFGRVTSFDWAPGKGVTKAISIAAIFGLLIVFSPQFTTAIEGFVFKTSGAKTVEGAFTQSRGRGITFFWQRFLEKPYTGHGFGIDVTHGNEKKPETFMGIPISAATEKGFLPTAFLEEVGIIGLVAFMPFFVLLIHRAIKTGTISLIAMFLSCLAVNVGEAVFFSPGYIGGYLWILIGLSTAKGWQATNEIQSNCLLADEPQSPSSPLDQSTIPLDT